MRYLLLLMFVELWLLIEVGAAIGALPAIALLLVAAALGAELVRRQGLNTLLNASRGMAPDQPPGLAMVEGMVLAIAGVLFLIPGFLSDVVAVLGLIPPLRRAVARKLLARSPASGVTVEGAVFRRGATVRGHRVIEGEFLRREPRDPRQ